MNKQLSPIATVSRFLEEHKAQIAAALPKHLSADRMARLALTALSQNRKLADCDPRSIFGAVVVASQLGLEIGVLGQGYLVPYKTKAGGYVATFIPGWQGLIDLVARAGRATVWTGAVFAGDDFEWGLGDSPHVRHVPCGEDDPDKLTHTYAVGRVKGAEWPIIEVWPIARIWSHRDRYNKVGTEHYSYRHQEMYARKVPLMQVLKYIPKSIELSAAMEFSHRVDEGRGATMSADFVVLDDEPAAGAAAESETPLAAQIRRKSKAGSADLPDAETESMLGGKPAISRSESLFADRLLMISEAEERGQLDFIADMSEAEFSPNQRRALAAAIANKRVSMPLEDVP